jgi:hypothetical protein
METSMHMRVQPDRPGELIANRVPSRIPLGSAIRYAGQSRPPEHREEDIAMKMGHSGGVRVGLGVLIFAGIRITTPDHRAGCLPIAVAGINMPLVVRVLGRGNLPRLDGPEDADGAHLPTASRVRKRRPNI